jgi:hypothetical protein
MAIISNVNILSTNAATNGVATCLYYLKETLKGAGWKVLSASNGTTLTGYNDGTTGIDSISSVDTMNSASAWFRITDPDSSREFVFMRGSTATTAVIKYSRSSKFTFGATPAGLPTTNGGDGIPLISTQATDTLTRSGSHGSAIMTTSGITTSRFHFIADNTSNNGVYPWYMFGLQTVTNTILCMYSHEAVQNGSCSSLDGDPSWLIIAPSSTDLGYVDGSGASSISTNSSARTWYKYGLVGSSFERAAGQPYTCGHASGHHSISYPANLGTNPYDGKDTAMNFLVRGISFPKGISTGIKYRGMLRTYPDILSNVYYAQGAHFPTDDWYVYLDKLLVPWPSGSIPTTSS